MVDRPTQILNDVFGHRAFRGCQRAVIDHMLAGQHALVIMPTGSGKSLCYQVPALCQGDLALVISPLIALMKDQVDALRRRSIDATFINSSLKRAQREQRYEAVARGDIRLLYVTPERFRKRDFLTALAQRRVTLLAVDEAHCVSAWGHDFRPDYTRLAAIRQRLGNPPTLALTATATPEVQKDILAQLGLEPDQVTLFHEGIDRPNLSLDVCHVWGDDEKITQVRRILKAHPGSAIVYFSLIRILEAFSEQLTALGIEHTCYHGQLDPKSRRRIQDAFMSGDAPLVLATNAFGMGVDKADIRSVTHAEIPGSLEAYTQEIGRAGRDGLPAQCTLLYDQHDLETQMRFIDWSNPGVDYYHRLHGLIAHETERVNAFGLEWLREKLHHKKRGDFRLETALSMLERHGGFDGTTEPLRIDRVGALPDTLTDPQTSDAKLERDRKRLLAMVGYAKHDGDRKALIHTYFGLPQPDAPTTL